MLAAHCIFRLAAKFPREGMNKLIYSSDEPAPYDYSNDIDTDDFDNLENENITDDINCIINNFNNENIINNSSINDSPLTNDFDYFDST